MTMLNELDMGHNFELALRRRIARRVAERLGRQPQVVAVLVFGSVATGTADEHSDIDLFILCQPRVMVTDERAPVLEGLGAGWIVDHPTDNALFLTTDEGRVVEGIPISLHYQTVAWIDSVLHEVLEHGLITTELLPFRPYTLPALLQHSLLLLDKEQHVARWQARTQYYPPSLKRDIVQHFVPILREQTDELVLAARRGIGPRTVLFHLDRAVDALISILYALNELYDPADRRAEQIVWPLLERVPADFVARLTAILTGPFDREGVVQQAHRFQELAQEVLAQAERRDLL